MAEYSLVKDPNGGVIGVWLSNPTFAHNSTFLRALCIENKLSKGVYAAVYSGNYRVESNTSDNRGGCFVIWGAIPPSQSASLKDDQARRNKTKRWWHFWK